MNLFILFYLIFFSIHSSIMLVDEFYFHRKRGLPKWERIGHPIDTIFTLICFAIIIFFPSTRTTFIIYGIFAIISSLVIIKDEAVHLKYCSKQEQYFHAILFVFHPVLLINLFLGEAFFPSFYIKGIILVQFISMVLFLIYQVLYWNFFRVSLAREQE